MYSKSGQDLARYFPEVVIAALTLREKSFVLDGEIVVPVDGRLSFDDLLQRIHPAASRVKKLAEQTPALFLAFDLLKKGITELAAQPLSKRRPQLEQFAARNFSSNKLLNAGLPPQVAEATGSSRNASIFRIKPVTVMECRR
jgi:ATP-dependent DNA ligase